MHTYMIDEMADAISQKLRLDNHEVLSVLHHYWEEKIALTWDVRDMLHAALNLGKPITKADAVALLHTMLDDHDPILGVSWQTLEIELQEYHLDWKRLTEDQYGEVQGVFKVWRKGDLIAHQIGLFPNDVQRALLPLRARRKALHPQSLCHSLQAQWRGWTDLLPPGSLKEKTCTPI